MEPIATTAEVALDTQDRHPGYYPSLFSVECGGPRRQKAPHGPGLNIQPGEKLNCLTRINDRWNVMHIWRDPGELYHYHTAVPGDSKPYGQVERLDLETLEPIQSSPALDCGRQVWCGSLVVHANGSLYVINGRVIHRLSPDLEVLAERVLPAQRPYNGLLIMADGMIVTKEIRLGDDNSHFVVLDPEHLEIAQVVGIPEPSMGRIAGDLRDGIDEIYVPGQHHLFRYRYQDGQLARDEGWTALYRPEGADHGLAWDSCLGADSVWLQDNGDLNGVHDILDTEPAGSKMPSFQFRGAFRGPVQVHRFSIGDPTSHDTMTPSGRADGGIVAPPVYVSQHRLLIGYDSINGEMSAFDYDGPGKLVRRWSRSVANYWQPMVYPDTAELIVDDAKLMQDDNIVVLDLLTGQEKARVRTGARIPNGMFPCPGMNRDFYYNTGFCLSRISVA